MKAIVFLLIMILSSSGYSQKENKSIREGNKQYRNENFSEAEINFLKSLEKNPSNAKSLYNLGNALYKQGRYDEAAEIFEALTKISPADDIKSKAFHNLGNSFLGMQDYEQGVEAYKESLRLNPSDMDTRYNLVYALNNLQQQEQQEQQQEQDKDKDDSEEENEQEQQPEEQQQDGEDEKEQQPRPDQLSPQEAEQILDALKQEEQKVLDEMEKQKQRAVRGRVEKEW